jgi:phosphotransferase system enzyme I (PtsI)
MSTSQEIRFDGIAASPGIAIGKVLVIGRKPINVERKDVATHEVEDHLEKLGHALSRAKDDVQKLYDKALASYGEDAAQVFTAHMYILQDPMILDETQKKIRNDLVNAEFAFSEVMDKYIKMLQGMQDDVFKSRTADINDLKRRVIRHILGTGSSRRVLDTDEPMVVFARELTPADTIRLDKSKVLGFAMDFGARTSHATILARSIRVPAVAGLKTAGAAVKIGHTVVLDGDEGCLIVNPGAKTLQHYEKKRSEYHAFQKKLEEVKSLPARTKDGKDVKLASNIEFPAEVDGILELKGDGIGLYRTEYLYLAGSGDPSEEQQFREYKNLIEKLNGKPMIIRTFDLGGDKPPESLQLPVEENPFLGVRGVRLYRNSAAELFRTQMKAILRASAFGDIRIMFPMIACVSEIRFCRHVMHEIQSELDEHGFAYNKDIQIGAMIEVPSAAAMADVLAKECDFLSIGTNDLIQYTIAVDRGNENLNYLYQDYNPAVLRFIRDTISRGHEQGAWVGMCGEMAGDPLMTMVLIGLGLDEFSVSPVSHLLIKEIVRHVEFSECESMAKKALDFDTSEEVGNYLKNIYNKKFANLKKI